MALPLLFVASMALQWWSSEEFAHRQVLAWESEVARRVLAQESAATDVALLSRVIEQILEMNPIISQGQLLNAVGADVAGFAQEACFGEIRVGIRLYSVPAGEFRFCRSAGEWLKASALSPPFLAAAFVLVLLMNFASWREQRQRLRAESAEAQWLAQKRVGDLARNIAHDIRGPLTALKILATRSLAEDQADLLRATIQRIDGLAEGLLKRADQEGNRVGSSGLKKSLFLPVIENVAAELRIRYPRHHVEVRAFEGSADLQAPLSDQALSRVLANFAENSLQASADGGTVWITVESAADGLTLSLIDEGRGIPPEILERLGQEEVTHGKESGHGLGFKGACDLVKSGGGRVEVTSKEGVGTRVDIRFPRGLFDG